MKINMETVTVQDCIDMYELKGAGVILDNGKVAGFRYDRGTKAHRPDGRDDRE